MRLKIKREGSLMNEAEFGILNIPGDCCKKLGTIFGKKRALTGTSKAVGALNTKQFLLCCRKFIWA